MSSNRIYVIYLKPGAELNDFLQQISDNCVYLVEVKEDNGKWAEVASNPIVTPQQPTSSPWAGIPLWRRFLASLCGVMTPGQPFRWYR